MPELDVSAFRDDLLRAGIAPAHVRRTIEELEDHFADLIDEQLAAGRGPEQAEEKALQALGDLQRVALGIRSQPDLRSWAWRWPRLALLIYPFACVAALPLAPLIAGAQNAAGIARWLTGLLTAGFVTALMFLLLQLTITLA